MYLGKFGLFLLELKWNICWSRIKLYVVVSVWKVVFILCMMLVLMSNFKFFCVKVLFYEGYNWVEGCFYLVYLEDVYNVESFVYK